MNETTEARPACDTSTARMLTISSDIHHHNHDRHGSQKAIEKDPKNMHATRRLCSSNLSSFVGRPKLLLPQPTFWESARSALRGAWAHMVDPTSREAYQEAVKNHIIKDDVLEKALQGPIITFSLFQNLIRSPLFSQHAFDAKEFVQTVGPALENFQYTLGLLSNQIDKEDVDEAIKNIDEKMKETDEEILASLHGNNEALLGGNDWKRQAEQDPDSLAGILSRMTHKPYFEDLYYANKLGLLDADPQRKWLFKNCTVNGTALVGARAEYVLDNNNGEPHEEFQASEELDKKLPVAAQMDVLFEVTHVYEVDDGTTTKDNPKPEIMKLTLLQVAIFEGWLSGGGGPPPKDALRWKLAFVRDPVEFPRGFYSDTAQ